MAIWKDVWGGVRALGMTERRPGFEAAANALRMNMNSGQFFEPDVERFLLEEIDTVPHLEALLLLRRNCARHWTTEELSKALYLPADRGQQVLDELTRRGLIVVNGGKYSYDQQSEREPLIRAVAETYRRELVRVSNMIHAKGSPAVRDFARAFRLKRD